jgi:ABC-type nickel/cobalt efflux system permease component RcnA
MKLLAVISIALVLTVSVYMIHRTMLSTDKKFKIQENQPFDYDLANTLTSYVVSSYCNQEDLANW